MAKSVLVYGGEAHMARFLERTLRRGGDEVVLVGHGDDLLSAIREHEPSGIVVVDPELMESTRSTVESSRLEVEVTAFPAAAMTPEQLSRPFRVFWICVVLVLVGILALVWTLSH